MTHEMRHPATGYLKKKGALQMGRSSAFVRSPCNKTTTRWTSGAFCVTMESRR